MSIQELVDKCLVELARNDFGSVAFPPNGFVRPMIKPHPTELARVGENKRASALKQNEMIMFGRSIISRHDPDFSGHAKMNAEPIILGKFEEHPFSAPVRAEKFRADQAPLKLARVAPAKDAVPRVQAKIDNLRAVPDVPLFAKPFDFGQLRHRADYVGQRLRSKVDRAVPCPPGGRTRPVASSLLRNTAPSAPK